MDELWSTAETMVTTKDMLIHQADASQGVPVKRGTEVKAIVDPDNPFWVTIQYNDRILNIPRDSVKKPAEEQTPKSGLHPDMVFMACRNFDENDEGMCTVLASAEIELLIRKPEPGLYRSATIVSWLYGERTVNAIVERFLSGLCHITHPMPSMISVTFPGMVPEDLAVILIKQHSS